MHTPFTPARKTPTEPIEHRSNISKKEPSQFFEKRNTKSVKTVKGKSIEPMNSFRQKDSHTEINKQES